MYSKAELKKLSALRHLYGYMHQLSVVFVHHSEKREKVSSSFPIYLTLGEEEF